ncbi:MAG TPA: hypothetical protein VHB53_03995 [Solirubrobacterales bacterium]|nr:hypothetical protein [Solirubrobacterales bacterium]
MTRPRLLVAGALVLSLALVGVYAAAGGASYEPVTVRNPCEPRPWHETSGGIEGLAEEFSLSALDGAACRLGVSRERLARALATKEGRERFVKRFHIDDEKLARAIRAGLIRAVDDAEEQGKLSPLIGAPLRATFEHIPIEQAIELTRDAKKIFSGAEGLLGPIGGMIEELLP